MTGELLLSVFPLGEHSAFFARLTCVAIDDFAQWALQSRLVTRDQLHAALLNTSLRDSAPDVLAEVEDYRILQFTITAEDARALCLQPPIN